MGEILDKMNQQTEFQKDQMEYQTDKDSRRVERHRGCTERGDRFMEHNHGLREEDQVQQKELFE